jgi:hypothetical protein
MVRIAVLACAPAHTGEHATLAARVFLALDTVEGGDRTTMALLGFDEATGSGAPPHRRGALVSTGAEPAGRMDSERREVFAFSNDRAFTGDRRRFLRDSTLTALGGAAGACKGGNSNGQSSATANAAGGPPKSAPTGGSMGANDTTRAVTAAQSAGADMDTMHETAMKAFPAATAGRGNQPLTPTLENGVKVY